MFWMANVFLEPFVYDTMGNLNTLESKKLILAVCFVGSLLLLVLLYIETQSGVMIRIRSY